MSNVVSEGEQAVKANAIALLGGRKAVCTVTLTNKQTQPIVLHRLVVHPHNNMTLTSTNGLKSDTQLTLLPISSSSSSSDRVILHAGDTYTSKFYFKAPLASPGVDHCVDSCDPNLAAQIAAVACHWTRICDDPSVVQKRDFCISRPSSLQVLSSIDDNNDDVDSVERWQPSSVALSVTSRALDFISDSSMKKEEEDMKKESQSRSAHCDQVLSKLMDLDNCCVPLPPHSLVSTLLKHLPRAQSVKAPFSVTFNKPVRPNTYTYIYSTA